MTETKNEEESVSLTFEDVRSHILKHWPSTVCPKCSSNSWTVGEDDQAIASIPVVGFDEKQTMFGPSRMALPLVWLLCNECGYVEFLSANAVRAEKSRNRGK